MSNQNEKQELPELSIKEYIIKKWKTIIGDIKIEKLNIQTVNGQLSKVTDIFASQSPKLIIDQKFESDMKILLYHILLFIFQLFYNSNDNKLKNELQTYLKICYLDFDDDKNIIKFSELQNKDEIHQKKYESNTITQQKLVSESDIKNFLQNWEIINPKIPELSKYVKFKLESLKELIYSLNFTTTKNENIQNKKQSSILSQCESQKNNQEEECDDLHLNNVQLQLNNSNMKLLEPIKIINKVKQIGNSKQLKLQPNGDILISQFFDQGSTQIPLIIEKGKCISQYKQQPIISEMIKFVQYDQEKTYDHSIYEGSFNQYFHPETNQNKGIFEIQNQSLKYQGEFSFGLFHGQGQLIIRQNIIYNGMMQNGMKHGKGCLLENELNYIGEFGNNKKNGQFQIQDKYNNIYYKNYINDIEQLQNQGNSLNTSLNGPRAELLVINNESLDNYVMQSLLPGKWLNQKIVDAYLGLIQKFYHYILNICNKNKTYYVNSCLFQDIFGSEVNENTEINDKIFVEKIDIYTLNKIVFFLNCERSHFITVVYEKKSNKLYLIDSLQQSRNILMKKIIEFLQFKLKIQETILCQNLQVEQQKNSFDCGVYTSYFVAQIIKNEELTIQQMLDKKIFFVQKQRINKLRYQMYQILSQKISIF